MNALTFHDTPISVIEHDGKAWMAGPEIGAALGYEDAAASLRQLYDRNKSEFSEDMSVRIKMTRTGVAPVWTRVFSPRGALLLAMHANTERAAAFRAFVLDILEGKRPLPGQSDPRADLARALLEQNPRWKKMLRYRGMGLSYREIGLLLGISHNTVQREMTTVRRLGLLDRGQIA